MSVPCVGHFPGPFFQVCGYEGGAVPLAEAVLFHRLGFFVEKSGDVEREPPSHSCDIFHIGYGFRICFNFLFFPLYEEGGEIEPHLG